METVYNTAILSFLNDMSNHYHNDRQNTMYLIYGKTCEISMTFKLRYLHIS